MNTTGTGPAPRVKHFAGDGAPAVGSWDGATATTDVHGPIDGVRVATVADTVDVDDVFEAAQEAQSRWRRVRPRERANRLFALASLMRSRADEVAELETANCGRPLANTRGEAGRAGDAVAYYAGWADKVTGTTIPVADAYLTYTLREPVGVALGIIPWNAPYVFAALKVGPAVATGNAIVLKPAAETPLSALRLPHLAEEAGLPRGLVQVATGGADVGARLVEDGRAGVVAFTGSDVGGRAVARAAARTLTRTSMELGGKSPQLVFDDADLDAALDGIMLGVFGQTGQMCIAGSRVYAQEGIRPELERRLASRVAALRVDDPRNDRTQLGPQSTARQRDKTLAMIATARDEGARVLAEAPLADDVPSGGYWVRPTAFTDVTPDMQVLREEVFGPVVAVSGFTDEADALARAHETDFGLAAGVWTADVGRAHRMARDLRVGNVWINTYRVLSTQVPFGGVGRSGYGREGGPAAVELYTRVKSVWTALTPGMPDGYAF